MLSTDCACIDSFDLHKYLMNVNEKLISFFKNKEKELEILINNLNQQSALQNFEEAQKGVKDYKSVNFSLRSHPMALLRDVLNTKY